MIASSLHNLAIVYEMHGRLSDVERLYQRASHIWEQVLGTDHYRLAYSLSDKAKIYLQQGKDIEAESLYKQVLHLWE